MIGFSAENSEVFTHKRALTKDPIFLRGFPIARRLTIRDLGLNFSAPLYFSEHVVIQSAKARRNLSLIIRGMKLSDSFLNVYKTRSITP